jgi:nicotinamide mononucleotide transporter
MSPTEIAAFLFGVLAVWLTTRENPWCWPLGLVNVALSGIVFYEARLYADTGLQGVYFALCLYGWYAWLRGGEHHGALAVSRAPRRWLAGLAAAGALFAVLFGFALRRFTDASIPFWDSSTTAFSLVAQALQTRKWIENWPLWIAVDVVYVGMYVYKSLFLMAGLYLIFLALAVLGHREWTRSLAARERAATAA